VGAEIKQVSKYMIQTRETEEGIIDLACGTVIKAKHMRYVPIFSRALFNEVPYFQSIRQHGP
jgi:hypothetical protein